MLLLYKCENVHHIFLLILWFIVIKSKSVRISSHGSVRISNHDSKLDEFRVIGRKLPDSGAKNTTFFKLHKNTPNDDSISGRVILFSLNTKLLVLLSGLLIIHLVLYQ